MLWKRIGISEIAQTGNQLRCRTARFYIAFGVLLQACIVAWIAFLVTLMFKSGSVINGLYPIITLAFLLSYAWRDTVKERKELWLLDREADQCLHNGEALCPSRHIATILIRRQGFLLASVIPIGSNGEFLPVLRTNMSRRSAEVMARQIAVFLDVTIIRTEKPDWSHLGHSG